MAANSESWHTVLLIWTLKKIPSFLQVSTRKLQRLLKYNGGIKNRSVVEISFPRISVKIVLSGIFGLVGLFMAIYGGFLAMSVAAGQMDPASAANGFLMVGLGLILLVMAFLICLKCPDL
jgi:hypothetical protein